MASRVNITANND